MNKKVLFAVLFGCVAAVAARELHASQMSINDLPQSLQQLNTRLAQTAAKASPAKLMSYYYEDKEDSYYDREESYGKHAKHHGHKYEREEKYAPKYEHEEKYAPKYAEDKYEKEEKYAAKYEPEYKDEYDYGYGPDKVVTKMWEKARSALRPQTTNAETFQFTSELTCTNPAEKAPAYAGADHGVLTMPIVNPATQLVTVGVCEWTVNLVGTGQEITETATLKGSNQVVCTFNEEAERHCKNGEHLHKGLSVSGQGLVYGFEGKPVAGVTPVNDVFLSLINGVVNAKNLKYDNGALQYFFGPPAIAKAGAMYYAEEKPAYVPAEKPAYAPVEEEADPVGTYVFVFKH